MKNRTVSQQPPIGDNTLKILDEIDKHSETHRMRKNGRECERERERERDIYKTRTLSTMGKKSPLHGISVVSGVNLVHFYFILFFPFYFIFSIIPIFD